MESGSENQPGFFARLKQHHTYQVAVAYGTFIAVAIQVVARAFPYFGWAAAIPFVVIVLLAGFPVALVLAWMLVKPKDPDRYTSWQKAHWKLGAALSAVVVIAVVISGFYAWRFSERHTERVTAEQTAKLAVPAFNPPADSLVVLPFANLSGDPKQQYFSDGITEELTDALGQNPSLRVIAWETASKFRTAQTEPAEIGEQLNVANILHGSIEREGDKLRITAELVDTRTNYQLWSHHYDDTFADIFKVQDQVSEAIANALKVEFAQADLYAGGTRNPKAHELVLQSRALLNKRDVASLSAAQKVLEQAITLDSGYADAHALLSRTLLRLALSSDLPFKATLPKIRAEAEKALALNPHDADAWVALGVADNSADPPDVAKARAEYRQALALDPSNASAHVDYGIILPLKPGLAEYLEATQLDPTDESAWNNLAVAAQDLGDWAQVVRASEALRKLNPKNVDSAFGLAYAYLQLRQPDKMVVAFNQVKASTPLDQEQVDTGRLTYRALADPALRPRALAALKNLNRHQSNLDVAGNLLLMYLPLGEAAAALRLLERICPADPIGCNDLGVNPAYQSLHGDPRFQKLAKKYTTVTVQ